MKSRVSTVAGMFYPGQPGRLRQLLSEFFLNCSSSGDAAGVVSPHAGYVYSGRTAAQAFAAFDEQFDGTFLVIGPSHRGFPTCISQVPWETPLGIIMPDTDLGVYLNLPVDERAMSYGSENSLEVQMPFIQYRFPNSRVVPLMMGQQTLSEVHRVSSIIISALEKYKEPRVHQIKRLFRVHSRLPLSHRQCRISYDLIIITTCLSRSGISKQVAPGVPPGL